MKLQRHSKILELINDHVVETQEDLAELLRKNGFLVTQATVSRDIRELMLTKTLTPDGSHKYVTSMPTAEHVKRRYTRVFREGVIGMDYAQNILVIKTLQGMASGVAAALDAMQNSEAVGSIAGDDIVFCAVKTEEKAIALMNKLKNFIADNQGD